MEVEWDGCLKIVIWDKECGVMKMQMMEKKKVLGLEEWDMKQEKMDQMDK